VDKLDNFLKIAGIINSRFIPQKTLRKTRIKLYNTLSLPAVLHGIENWIIKARDARRITAAEMKYMSRKAGYTWTNYKTNTEIAEEQNITPVLDKREEYGRNLLQHLNKVTHNRILKNYRTTGIRHQGIPLGRLIVV
jgi:ribosomal 50S subunit-recycling heat shock protein